MNALFTLIKGLITFSLNQGILSKESWEVVKKNKYLLYIILTIIVQFLAFIYAINQAHLRLHREEAYLDKIHKLEEQIQSEKQKRISDVSEEKSKSVEQDLETLIKDSQDEFENHTKQNPN